MPRRHRRRPVHGVRPLRAEGAAYLGERREPGPSWAREETFVVRPMGAQAATKTYICPGCENPIRPGTSHIVAWPLEWAGGVADRRHWHTWCWARR
ncbi:hypothetical protein L1O03_07215 [Corynebacterium uropygiale]|uniref:ATP/GTP-binding protein n=1 Tax=Corynebacterium uropygiale TaxID=1775911 RepID=A0A9X1U7P8_9CORY|nr:hypothetical protein [Corynebacterium uropygiale]MCF4006967.1 hypothetical protein [Corynebacterium uropygiale]